MIRPGWRWSWWRMLWTPTCDPLDVSRYACLLRNLYPDEMIANMAREHPSWSMIRKAADPLAARPEGDA